METVTCSGQFNTSFFRLLTILLLISIIGILLYGFYTIKTQVTSLEAQALEKENELKCHVCNVCKTFPLLKAFCTDLDCTKC